MSSNALSQCPGTRCQRDLGPGTWSQKVLFEYTVVNVHLSQHHHLLALDVCGGGLIPNPHADTVTHRELAPVEDGVGR